MSITPSLTRKATLGATVAGLWMLAAQPAHAQSAACVNLLVGAGYSAWMAVHFGDSFYWSPSFPIGHTQCIKLPVSGMVNGAPYNVVVSAALGSSKVPCTPSPSPYSSSDTNSVSWNAWGTTLNVKCQMPSTDMDFSHVSVTPTPEGAQALETWRREGPKPAPR
jgi:hypothetical protein